MHRRGIAYRKKRAARRTLEQSGPGPAKSSQKQPDLPKISHEQTGEEPKAARSSQQQPEAATSSRGSSQEQPTAARDNQEQPREDISGAN